jgi:hypothetical protein
MTLESSSECRNTLLSYLAGGGQNTYVLFLGCQVINSYCEILAKCPNARYVRCMFGMNPTAASALSGCPKLTTFICENIDGPSLVALIDAAPALQNIFCPVKGRAPPNNEHLRCISKLH